MMKEAMQREREAIESGQFHILLTLLITEYYVHAFYLLVKMHFVSGLIDSGLVSRKYDCQARSRFPD